MRLIAYAERASRDTESRGTRFIKGHTSQRRRAVDLKLRRGQRRQQRGAARGAVRGRGWISHFCGLSARTGSSGGWAVAIVAESSVWARCFHKCFLEIAGRQNEIQTKIYNHSSSRRCSGSRIFGSHTNYGFIRV